MNGVRHQFLSRSAAAEDQDRRAGRSGSADELIDLLHLRTLAHHAVLHIYRFGQTPVLTLKPSNIARVLQSHGREAANRRKELHMRAGEKRPTGRRLCGIDHSDSRVECGQRTADGLFSIGGSTLAQNLACHRLVDVERLVVARSVAAIRHRDKTILVVAGLQNCRTLRWNDLENQFEHARLDLFHTAYSIDRGVDPKEGIENGGFRSLVRGDALAGARRRVPILATVLETGWGDFISIEIDESRAADADAVAVRQVFHRKAESIDERPDDTAQIQYGISTFSITNGAVPPRHHRIVEIHIAARVPSDVSVAPKKQATLAGQREPRRHEGMTGV